MVQWMGGVVVVVVGSDGVDSGGDNVWWTRRLMWGGWRVVWSVGGEGLTNYTPADHCAADHGTTDQPADHCASNHVTDNQPTDSVAADQPTDHLCRRPRHR